MIRVVLPPPLRILAGITGEVEVDVIGSVTICAILDVIEGRYPVLRGTIRDLQTRKRRPFVRFFVDENDYSHEPTDQPLPEVVATGAEPLIVLGAIAGG